jgi:hypothetical protein
MIDKTPVHEVVDRVLQFAVSVPTRDYYVNYDLKTHNFIPGKGSTWTISKYHIGPYHKVLAEFLMNHWVRTQADTTKPANWGMGYTLIHTASISLKPKRDSIMGPAPTKEHMQALLLSALVGPLEVYREIQHLPPTL